MKIIGYWGDKEPQDKISIDSCGHIFTFHGREINRPNGRNNYLLLYIYSGEAKFFFGDREVMCKSGDFVLYAPNEPQHHIYESNKSGEFYYIHFSSEDDSLPSYLNMKTQTPYHSKPSSALCDEFERILSELQAKNFGYKDVCIHLTSQLFIKIQRQIIDEPFNTDPSDIKTVIQYISKHYDEDTSLDEYARMCGISKTHLIRRFNKICGMSPLKYRNEIRLSHAKELLCHSDITIKRIAEQTGYSSPEYFSETFKKAFGLSPLDYRKQSKSNYNCNT